MKFVIVPLDFYMDVGKRWFAVKPTDPKGPMFYEFQTIHASLMDVNPGDTIYSKIVKIVSTGQSVTVIEVNPIDFTNYLDPEDKMIRLPPQVESERIQKNAEKKLDEILASAFVTHQVNKHLCEALKESGDFFSQKDLQYIDSLHEIMLEKEGVKHDESD